MGSATPTRSIHSDITLRITRNYGRSGNRSIPELDLIDEIEALSAGYEERHGRPPVNVSHWDPSEEFMGKLSLALPVFPQHSSVFYNFSYFLESHAQVRSKLG